MKSKNLPGQASTALPTIHTMFNQICQGKIRIKYGKRRRSRILSKGVCVCFCVRVCVFVCVGVGGCVYVCACAYVSVLPISVKGRAGKSEIAKNHFLHIEPGGGYIKNKDFFGLIRYFFVTQAIIYIILCMKEF